MEELTFDPKGVATCKLLVWLSLKAGGPKSGTLKDSEDPDEMPLYGSVLFDKTKSISR